MRAYALLLLCTLWGCGGALRRVDLLAVEGFRRYGTVGADLHLLLRNSTQHAILLADARLEIDYDGAPVLHARLRGGAELPAGETTHVGLRWKFEELEPHAYAFLQKRLREENFEGITARMSLCYETSGKIRTLSPKRMPVSDFLAKFGVSAADLRRLADTAQEPNDTAR